MPPTDPYGVDLRLSDDGDLVVDRTGALTAITGTENCAQALVLRARTYPGELPLQQDFGSGLEAALIGQKSLDPELAQARANVELRAIVESDRRFLAARNIEARDVTPDGTKLAVRLTLVLANGEQLQVSDLADVRTDEVTEAPTADSTLDSEDLDAIADFSFLGDDDVAADVDELAQIDSDFLSSFDSTPE